MAARDDGTMQALQEAIDLPDNKTVTPGSQAERLCKRLISVVMCTFAKEPATAIIMRGFCDFPEREKIKTSQLAKKMRIDQKTVSTTLKQLKAGGYILESSFQESFNKHARASHMKTVRYHIDYSYFINMIRLRLHEIVVRLSAKQEKNDEKSSIGSFLCVNEQCKEFNISFSTLDLMSNKNNYKLDKRTGNTIYICDMCNEELVDESEATKGSHENNLDIKRAFNQQSLPLTKLLNLVENEVKKERAYMITEQKRAYEEKENLESGFGELSYKAANLNFGKKKKRGQTHDENQQTLDHLSRLYVVFFNFSVFDFVVVVL